MVVEVVQRLRWLGLTLKEIQELTASHRERPDEPLEAQLRAKLELARRHSEAQIAVLQAQRQRILEFVSAQSGSATRPSPLARLLAADPRGGNVCLCP